MLTYSFLIDSPESAIVDSGIASSSAGRDGWTASRQEINSLLYQRYRLHWP